jgi:hypothetical protein
MMELPGLPMGQFLALAGLGAVLLVLLLVLGAVLKMTRNLIKLGCLIIAVLLLIAFVALQLLGG